MTVTSLNLTPWRAILIHPDTWENTRWWAWLSCSIPTQFEWFAEGSRDDVIRYAKAIRYRYGFPIIYTSEPLQPPEQFKEFVS